MWWQRQSSGAWTCHLFPPFPFRPHGEAINWGGVLREHSPTRSLLPPFICLAPIIKYLRSVCLCVGLTGRHTHHCSLDIHFGLCSCCRFIVSFGKSLRQVVSTYLHLILLPRHPHLPVSPSSGHLLWCLSLYIFSDSRCFLLLLTLILCLCSGMGDMAVSNSIGSNVFDILVGLGLPWALKTLAINYGSDVSSAMHCCDNRKSGALICAK